MLDLPILSIRFPSSQSFQKFSLLLEFLVLDRVQYLRGLFFAYGTRARVFTRGLLHVWGAFCSFALPDALWSFCGCACSARLACRTKTGSGRNCRNSASSGRGPIELPAVVSVSAMQVRDCAWRPGRTDSVSAPGHRRRLHP